MQWVLPYIDMNQPWSYMYSPSWSPLPPPSPPDSSGSSQCTRPEHLSFCQCYITIFCLIGRSKWFCYGFQGALIHCTISSFLGLLQIVFVVCLLTLIVAIFDIHRLNFYIYSNLALFSLWLLFLNTNNNNNYRLISHHNIVHFHFV